LIGQIRIPLVLLAAGHVDQAAFPEFCDEPNFGIFREFREEAADTADTDSQWNLSSSPAPMRRTIMCVPTSEAE
jgi:hypothetical protein